MMKRFQAVKVNVPGGILAAGDLLTIAEAAEAAQVDHLQFGNRQQLFLKTPVEQLNRLTAALQAQGIFYELNSDRYPNIVSSYVVENVFQSGYWLREGVYKDILDGFQHKPLLKISLVDQDQAFVPFFTSHLNFIASGTGNYWYLYIRFPKTKALHCWPGLIYSADIPRISQVIENCLMESDAVTDGNMLYKQVQERASFITRPVTEELRLPDQLLPYYEGFNEYEQKNWLGIYRRNELFPLQLVKDLCLACLQTKVGQLYCTPWKSLIIKNIERSHNKLWNYVLGKYRINVRHAANELNWQVEDLCEDGLVLKRYLVNHFDREDVRTVGLSFAIQTKPQSNLFASVKICKKNTSRNQRAALDRYTIFYSKDFNPNSSETILFRSDVEKENLPVYLVSLCKYYYELQSQAELINHQVYRQQQAQEAIQKRAATKEVYECPDCLTIYNDDFGDQENGFAPGTAFAELPAAYACATCGSAKEHFRAVEKPLLPAVA